MYGPSDDAEFSLWGDTPCTDQLPYICQVKVTFFTFWRLFHKILAPFWPAFGRNLDTLLAHFYKYFGEHLAYFWHDFDKSPFWQDALIKFSKRSVACIINIF